MAKLVLFGAGHHTPDYIRLLTFFHCRTDYIADNDRCKTGSVFCGAPVIGVKELVSMDCRILISCTYWREITEQLSDLGIADKIISLWELLKEAVLNRTFDAASVRPVGFSKTICVDLYSGSSFGGAENWNYSIAKELAKEGADVRIFASSVISIEESEEERAGVSVWRFGEKAEFADMVRALKERLPLIFLNCFTEGLFFAALAVKAICPDQIQIIDEVHLGFKQAYDLHVQFDDFVDKYICVSGRIKETLNKSYGIQKERLFFKEQPVATDESFQKNYDASFGGPIRIGYAARLVREQKRADLLPLFLKKLKKRGVDYRLEVAGSGDEEDTIKKELNDCGADLNVAFLGRLNYADMAEFWKRQDVYLNFSEYEGASLAMLEAMSFGCVPVVTDVSGVSDYIENEISGYICPIGDLDAIAEKIMLLHQHRDFLETCGQEARRSVLVKCKKEDYAKALRQWIGEVG